MTTVKTNGTSPAICHVCHNQCGILVTVEGGRAVSVNGDPLNVLSAGYTCTKGRALPTLLGSPDRITRTLKRVGRTFTEVPSTQAIEEIAERLRVLVDRYGPRSVAVYNGTHGYVGSPVTLPTVLAFVEALGTPMFCHPLTIDQPGKLTARALHGDWMAPARTVLESEVSLFVGMNPMVSHICGPTANAPGWVRDAKKQGTKLIVIDPRKTEMARNAFLHVQPVPGHDIALLASISKILLDESLHDAEFAAENVDGVEALQAALKHYDPEIVAARAGVAVDDIVLAARTLGSSRRVWAGAGTGANMAQSGTVLEYLLLVIQTLCGSWLREDDLVKNPGTLVPQFPAIAQAFPPFPGVAVGEALRVHGLVSSIAGVQTAAVPDEILLDGDGQVRALISVGGNPATAWPDQLKTLDALDRLDLLVQIDPWMSQTAQRADYVIPPKMCLETPMTSQFADLMGTMAANFNRSLAWAQYNPAIVDVPAGSDLVEEWEFFYVLAQHLGLQLTVKPLLPFGDVAPYELDMTRQPRVDDMLEIVTRGSRVPLAEIKRHPHGTTTDVAPIPVAPKADGWAGRLDVGNADILQDLEDLASTESIEANLPYRLISRRMNHVFNSSCNIDRLNGGRRHNPAFMHPSDLDALGVRDGDRVRITSRRSSVLAVVTPDDTVRPGCVSLAHNYGADPSCDDDVEQVGSSSNRLNAIEFGFDRYTGQPRMSNIPVAVAAVAR